MAVADGRLDNLPISVRPSGSRRVRYNPTIKIIMLLSAILNEPACAWIRNRNFESIWDARRLPDSAINFRDKSSYVTAAMGSDILSESVLLYEGAVDTIGLWHSMEDLICL